MRHKHYYVDSHEALETRLYRAEFVSRYLDKEMRMYRWVQIPAKLAEQMRQEGLLAEGISGYSYTDTTTNVDMEEFHVDDCILFDDYVAKSKFGGNLSVRMDKDKKPILMVGQDECIFKQFAFSPKCWTANGIRAPIPKDEGLGLMVSAFVSREFGFGMPISQEDLEAVNAKRQGTEYSDKEAAISVQGTAAKKAITKKGEPFVVEFEYGANKQGYWTYEHMIVQMEDCIDVLHHLYPEFEVHFLFDHSCGHDRQRPDGLNANNMSKFYGGVQPKMHDSLIESHDYLGSYNGTLRVGDTQAMVWQEGDVGPYYLSPPERLMTKYDRSMGGDKRKKYKTKDVLVQELEDIAGIRGAKGTKVQLLKLCEQHQIPSFVLVDKIEEGWLGKPKGMLQILFERGFIDPSRPISFYTVDGRKDNLGTVIPDTALRGLMLAQPDFIQEETLLQFHGRQLGVRVDRTPKCHPELAGEGVEYAWGFAKNLYRQRTSLISFFAKEVINLMD